MTDHPSLTAWRPLGSRGRSAVLAIATSGGNVVAATANGVAILDGDGLWTPLGDGPGPTVALAFSGGGELLAGTTVGLHRWVAEIGWTRLVALDQVTGVAVVPAESGPVFIAGCAADGVFRSEDEGKSWHSASAGLRDLRVTCVAAGRKESQTLLLVGTQTGAYMSRNGGRSWRSTAGGGEAYVSSVQVSAEGDLLVVSEDVGLLVSRNAGRSWSCTHPTTADTAVLEEACATPDGGVVALAGGRVLHAAEIHGSDPWQPTGDLPSECFALAVDESGAVLAGTRAHGVMRLDSRGWQTLGGSLPTAGTGALQWIGGTGDVYWTGLESGLAVSADAGDSWTELDVQDSCVTGVALQADGQLVVSTASGLHKQRLGGWSLVDDRPTTSVLSHGDVLVAVTDGGDLLISDASGQLSERWRETPGPPAPVQRIASWGSGLVAVTTAPEQGGWRYVVWRAAGPDGLWAPVLSTVGQAPLAMAVTSDQLYVAVGSALLAMGHDATRAVLRGVVYDDVGPTTVLDLCVARGSLLASTTSSLVTSDDRGVTWTIAWKPAEPLMSMVQAGDTLLALDRTSSLWATTDPRQDERSIPAASHTWRT